MINEEQKLWGLPVVVTEAVPRGVIYTGRMPTWEEVVEYGSFANALKAIYGEWAKVEGIEIDE